FKIADMGVGMVTKGRISFTPKRIKGLDGLRAILAKAKEIEALARATAIGIRKVAEALQTEGGEDAVALRIAEAYI
ncbi:MAG: hypothetical protein N2559_13605, partial [Anaerolineae bacterium]|nr:hypothetical protein [Anaerolineae bacterium]